jgi:hypothetical protein
MRRHHVLCLSGTVAVALMAGTSHAVASGTEDVVAPIAADRASPASRAADVADGAVTIGGIAAAGWSGLCVGNSASFVQKVSGPGTASYSVPGSGVITSASHFATPQATGSMRVEFLKPGVAADVWDVVAYTPLLAMTPNAVNTWPLRIPVPAGTTVGIFMPASNVACNYAGVTGDEVRAAAPADPSVDSSFEMSIPFDNIRLNLSAVWEPDVDGDGFGDASQDACPQLSAQQDACPAPLVTVTKKPKKKSTKRMVKIKFISSVPGSTYTCKVDRKRAKPCASPFKKRFRYGKHKVVITATSPVGIVGTPVKVKFRIARPA